MPHLKFEINRKIDSDVKLRFANEVRGCFSQVMDTGTDHIAISIREYGKNDLTIGRANPQDNICLMNLDIRQGRRIEKRRELAVKFMAIVETNFNIDAENQYITITQHPGEDYHLVEKYLADWKPDEDPLA